MRRRGVRQMIRSDYQPRRRTSLFVPPITAGAGSCPGQQAGLHLARCAGGSTARKPKLLFSLSGLLLLRLETRQLLALLFQLPPRIARFEPLDRTPSPWPTPPVWQRRLGGHAQPPDDLSP